MDQYLSCVSGRLRHDNPLGWAVGLGYVPFPRSQRRPRYTCRGRAGKLFRYNFHPSIVLIINIMYIASTPVNPRSQ